jgi:hypothetical protein
MLSLLNKCNVGGGQRLRPVPHYNCGLQIGWFCGRVIHRARPEPVAVIDEVEVFG